MSPVAFRLRRRLAAVEPFGEHDAFLHRHSRSIGRTRPHLALSRRTISCSFSMPRLAQPVFGRVHDGAAITLARDEPDRPRRNRPSRDGRHGRPAGGDHGVAVTADQHCRIRPSPRQRDVGGGIVPRPRQAASLPQRDDIGDIGVLDRRDRQRSDSAGAVTAPCRGS